MNNKSIIAILVGIVILGGAFLLTNSDSSDKTALETTVESTSINNVVNTEKPAPVLDNYVAYSAEALAKSQENGKTVLFFHADWCPTCRAAEKDIIANIQDLPSDITILKASFDTDVELKNKYKVVSQHTFVQVDASGEEVTKWLGGGLASIVDNVK